MTRPRPRNLSDALEFLASFTDWEQKGPGRAMRASLDLDRMRRLAAHVGNPQAAFSALHVAGSKGKGSTALLADALLRAHGFKTGRFLSPHLETPLERITIDGANVTEERFAELAERLRPWVEASRGERPEDLPSFFEAVTVMSWLEFAERRIDVGVIEVGLGGRLDATNILDDTIAIVTALDLEHTRVLGDSLHAIAREKAGIARPDRPLITTVPSTTPEGRALRDEAERRGARVLGLGDDFRVEGIVDRGLRGSRFDLVLVGDRRLDALDLAAPGPHQVENAAAAVVAVGAFLDRRGRQLDPVAIRGALASTRLPGRLEYLDASESTCGLPVLLDTAHTPKSMTELGRFCRSWLPEQPTLVVGFLRDKDLGPCLRALGSGWSRVIAVTPDSPRALPAIETAESIRAELGDIPTTHLADIGDVPGHLSEARPSAAVIAGSTYVTGRLRRLLRRRQESEESEGSEGSAGSDHDNSRGDDDRH